MKVRNANTLGTTKARKDALAILEAGLAAIDTTTVLESLVRVEEGGIRINEVLYPLQGGKLVVVGVGKCAAVSAIFLEKALGPSIARGVMIDVAQPSSASLSKIDVIVGTHPVPSETNVAASAKLLETLADLSKDDLVLVVVSGGGSTLLCQPTEPMTYADEADVLAKLTNAGATIEETNTVRRHLSKARGGGIARAAYPARVVALIFSDVPGDELEAISSGPTVRDISTIADAKRVLAKYDIAFNDAFFTETPKEENYFENVTNVLALSNMTALRAMEQHAETLGYTAEIRTATLTGEARDAAKHIVETLHAAKPPAAHLYGGETTVTITGPSGKSGRNAETALAGLALLEENELFMACASDGRDNTDAAGAIADAETARKALQQNLSADDHLARHDAASFFAATNNLIMTGPTGSNVSDLFIAISE